jgi:hypothetical protein
VLATVLDTGDCIVLYCKRMRAPATLAAAVAAAAGGALLLASTAAAGEACYYSSKYAPRLAGFECPAGASAGECINAAALYNTGDALAATTYSYTSDMNGKTMDFTTDCSCWGAYVLNSYYPAAFALFPNDTTVSPPVPRAAQFYDFLAAPSGPWSTVADIRKVAPGDVLAYRLPPGSTDTGHVMLALDDSKTPMTLPYDGRDDALWVYVADASTVIHRDDTRCAKGCRFKTGLGRGYMAFAFDTATGVPTQFQFCETCNWHAAQITAGRLNA